MYGLVSLVVVSLFTLGSEEDNNMKHTYKILIGIVTTCVLLFAIDWVVGTWSEMMYYKSKYGIFHRQIYCLQESKDDIMILGSSRAAHHYVPKIFEDSLRMSCYNAGSDGMCIYYHYAILASRIHRRVPPKMVILEVMGTDAEVSKGATFSLDAALDRLAPHYGEVPEIDSLFALNGWTESLKLLFKTYRYNSKFVQIIKCNYVPWPENKGYEALTGTMEVVDGNVADVLDVSGNAKIEYRKVKYVRKLIDLCKNNKIKLVMCFSPYYNTPESDGVLVIKKLAENNSVPFLDYGENHLFQKTDYFRDESHLNDNGPTAYTKEIVKQIRKKCYYALDEILGSAFCLSQRR